MIKDYGKMYAEFLSIDIGSQKEAEMMSVRNDLIKRGRQAQVTAVELCVCYSQYGGSVFLKDFIDRTKWVLVDTTEERVKEWKKNNPMRLYTTDNSHCIENLTMAMLTYYTYQYLKEVGI